MVWESFQWLDNYQSLSDVWNWLLEYHADLSLLQIAGHVNFSHISGLLNSAWWGCSQPSKTSLDDLIFMACQDLFDSTNRACEEVFSDCVNYKLAIHFYCLHGYKIATCRYIITRKQILNTKTRSYRSFIYHKSTWRTILQYNNESNGFIFFSQQCITVIFF